MSEQMNEKDVEDYLMENIFGGGPRSPSEATAATGEAPPPEPPEDAPVVVPDEPPGRSEPQPPEEPHPEEAPGEDEEPPAAEEVEDEHVAWATKKYGEDPNKWAKASFDMEQHISRLSREKQEAEQLASQWYEYAQQAEQQANQNYASSMPLSAAEEEWIERSVVNPLEAARQARFAGNANLYTGVLRRVAEENPMYASQIGMQVETEIQAYSADQAAQANGPQPTLVDTLGQSFSRLGIDMNAFGPRMADKLGELGEYHPYTQAILHGDQGQSDLAVQAVYDLVRVSPAAAKQADREAAIRREGELRREAASIQTGGSLQPVQPKPESKFLAAMTEEWKERGQWGDE